MSEQEKRDIQDLALLLQDLTAEDQLQVQGVIAGIQMARRTPPEQEQT